MPTRIPTTICHLLTFDQDGAVATPISINGRWVKMSDRAAALLACLQNHPGRVVPYRRMAEILGLRTMRSAELRILRQYVMEVKRALAASRSPYVLAVAAGVGHALCPLLKTRRKRRFAR
jgi:DNA-binding response OmpR family regulator